MKTLLKHHAPHLIGRHRKNRESHLSDKIVSVKPSRPPIIGPEDVLKSQESSAEDLEDEEKPESVQKDVSMLDTEGHRSSDVSYSREMLTRSDLEAGSQERKSWRLWPLN